MNVTVHQTISIHQLRIDSVNNSSIVQIGSAGIIKGLSNLYNTGGFTGPAPQAKPIPADSNEPSAVSLVPFAPPT